MAERTDDGVSREPPSPPTYVVSTDRNRRPSKLWRKPIPLVLAVSGSAAAAFAGLVAEDFFPADGPWFAFAPRWARIVFLVLSLSVAGWAAWQLVAHRRSRGTLYYLRFQNETNEDFHREVVATASEEYLDFRSISAWCDPGPIVDARDQVARMRAEFERAANDDLNDSGYDVAPNLIFPVSLALGYDWLPPHNVVLREFNGKAGGVVEEFQWKLGCATASGAGCCTEKRGAMHRGLHFDLGPGRFNLAVRSDGDAVSNLRVRSVWLEYWLTEKDWSGTPAGVSPAPAGTRKLRMTSPLKTAADIRRIVRVEGPSTEFPDKSVYQLLKYSPHIDQTSTGLSVRKIAEGAAFHLGHTLGLYPNATVFVAAAMPKTVALAMGYLMTRPPFTEPAWHPWRRIVPMGHFLKEPHPELRPMWVRESQRDPAELIRRAGMA